LIGRRTGPLGLSPGYALAQDFKKRSLSEKKIRKVLPILPSHAGNRKNPDYYLLSSQVLLRPKLRSFRS